MPEDSQTSSAESQFFRRCKPEAAGTRAESRNHSLAPAGARPGRRPTRAPAWITIEEIPDELNEISTVQTRGAAAKSAAEYAED
jgi:hypothetical protein